MEWQDGIVSFFLGIIVVVIFKYIFEPPTIVIEGNIQKQQHKVKNVCHEVNFKSVACPDKSPEKATS